MDSHRRKINAAIGICIGFILVCITEIYFREQTYEFKIIGEPVKITENQVRVRLWETRMTIFGRYEKEAEYVGNPMERGAWRDYETGNWAHHETRENLNKAVLLHWWSKKD